MYGSLYQPIYMTVIGIIGLIFSLRYISSPGYTLQQKGSGWFFPFIICLAFAIWLGLRPIHPAFGDTVNYALEYNLLDLRNIRMDWSGEWIWRWLMVACKSAGLSANQFFLIVELVYVMTAFFAFKRFVPNNPMLGLLFLMSSLMFYTFGVNGLRNGMACHIVLLAISLLLDDKYLFGILLSLIAFGIHRSTLLPLASAAVAILIVRDFRYALMFWIASIFISLVAGGAISNFFAGLGFDDRMTQYTAAQDMSIFSRTGFRWDFLLYSAVPVVMGWYICIKRQISDNWYNVICMVYCLCNAFWVMVIRSAYSNRFAYLSWFIYPLVIAYPLINLPVWENQDRKTGWILLVYVGFTVFMMTFVWG